MRHIASFRLSILISRSRGCYVRIVQFAAGLLLPFSLFLFFSHLLSPEITGRPTLHSAESSLLKMLKSFVDVSHLLFMSFIYSTETTKLNFPRFLGRTKCARSTTLLKTKRHSRHQERVDGPGINPLFSAFFDIYIPLFTFFLTANKSLFHYLSAFALSV